MSAYERFAAQRHLSRRLRGDVCDKNARLKPSSGKNSKRFSPLDLSPLFRVHLKMAYSGHGVVYLRIQPLKSARGIKEYYRGVQASYYQGTGHQGTWGGKGAKLLELEGPVLAEQFNALVDNRNPLTGGQLTPRIKKNRRVAYDANTHAPKSVSLLSALAGDSRPIDALHEATVETMTAMEENAATRGASTDRPTGNLVWAAFPDSLSRPVGGVPDPHLHEHVVIFNATQDAAEGRWKAAQFGKIKEKAPLLQAIFSMKLAKKITELGYELGWDGARWEIKGVPPDLLKRFSRRTDTIENAAKEWKIRSAAEKAKLGARTRERKSSHTRVELEKIWADRLTPEERQTLDTVKEQALARAAAPKPLIRIITPAMAVKGAIETLSEHASIWTRDDMLTAALYAGRGEVELAQIEAVLETPEFAANGPHGLLRGRLKDVEVYTTEAILREEQTCINLAMAGRGESDSLGRPPIDARVGKRRLSEEQLDAARKLAASNDFVTCLFGKAGTGKSTLVQAIMPALKAANRKVILLAPTHKAVGVLKDDGFSDAMTLSKFLVSAANKEIAPRTVLWLDEAGLTGMRHMAHLLRIAKLKGCRVVLAGDISQHTAVARGDALRLLSQRAGLTTASVSTIVRQTDPEYREAIQFLSQGKTDPESAQRGLRLLERRGSICTYRDANDRFTEAAKKVASLVMAEESHLAIAPTHKEIALLTDAVRQELTQREYIKPETARAVPVMRERKRLWYEKTVPWLYNTGEIIELVRDTTQGKRGQRFEVVHADSDVVTVADADGRRMPLNLEDAACFNIFERSSIELAVGDRIRISKTAKVGEELFFAGGLHTIKRFDASGNMTLDDGRVLPRDFGHIDYGWATTSHSAQGATVDHVVIVQSAASGRAASLEQVYVSASRGKKDVWIFTDDSASLKKAVSRSSERPCALEVFMPLPKPGPERTAESPAPATSGAPDPARSMPEQLAAGRAAIPGPLSPATAPVPPPAYSKSSQGASPGPKRQPDSDRHEEGQTIDEHATTPDPPSPTAEPGSPLQSSETPSGLPPDKTPTSETPAL